MGVDAEMFVQVKPPLSDREVERVAFELGSAFGHRQFFIDRTGKYGEGGQHAVQPVDVFTQDRPNIKPKRGEQFLQVHLWTRYYGIGYERGDLPLILSIAQWFDLRLPGCEVWYGGDSSGILAVHLDAVERASLWAHFVKHARRPYLDRFGQGLGGTSRHCTFCDEPMMQYGFGAKYEAFSCAGCGFQEETRDSGLSWAEVAGDKA